MFSSLAGMESDPRCQPGAYIQQDDKRLYEVLEICEDRGMVRVENCLYPDMEIYLTPPNLKKAKLVRPAPAMPDRLPEAA